MSMSTMTIGREWERFRTSCVPPDVGEQEMEIVRWAYYTGAATALARVREILISGVKGEAKVEAINVMLEECARFRNDLDQEVRDENAGEIGRN